MQRLVLLVRSRDGLSLKLLESLKGNGDDDEETGATKRHELAVGERLADERQHGDKTKAEGAGQGDAVYNAF